MTEAQSTYEPVVESISELRLAYERSELSPSIVAEKVITAVRAADSKLHAFHVFDEDFIREQASIADKRIKNGDCAPLLGIPISIKDAFHVAGQPTSNGSAAIEWPIALRDSGAVARLRAAGAILVGKTNTAEYGQSATTENAHGPATRNPWDLSRTPGGSSGGAAASVAAGMVTAAIGSDGGGSLRIPGAFTGLIGFKATYGRCKDEYGLRAMSSFCCPGPLTRTVADARVIFSVLADTIVTRSRSLHNVKLRFDHAPEGHPVDPNYAAVIDAAVSKVRESGIDVSDTQLPLDGWKKIFGPIVLEEEHRERTYLLDLADPSKVSDYELISLKAGRKLTPEIVATADRKRTAFTAGVDSAFGDADILITPTLATTAFTINQRPETIAGKPVDATWGAFPFTAPFNITGNPAIALPVGEVDGLPVSLQLVARRGEDELLLNVAEDIEELLGGSDLMRRGGAVLNE